MGDVAEEPDAKRCVSCFNVLTRKASIAAGLGPECLRKLKVRNSKKPEHQVDQIVYAASRVWDLAQDYIDTGSPESLDRFKACASLLCAHDEEKLTARVFRLAMPSARKASTHRDSDDTEEMTRNVALSDDQVAARAALFASDMARYAVAERRGRVGLKYRGGGAPVFEDEGADVFGSPRDGCDHDFVRPDIGHTVVSATRVIAVRVCARCQKVKRQSFERGQHA